MRQRHLLRQKTGTDLNITSMIDVIFILLIFFVATTSFVKETGVEVERPSAATAERQEKLNILIAISENGEIWMGGRLLDIRTVRANVEQALAENPESTVIITADKSSRTGLLIQVMDQARLAGVSTVSIAAIKE
jgi:biopolymer transport protein ExbD